MFTSFDRASPAFVAQWIERLRPKEGVGSSILSGGISFVFRRKRRGVPISQGPASFSLCCAERCPSGLWCGSRNAVWRKPPRVQILLSPFPFPFYKTKAPRLTSYESRRFFLFGPHPQPLSQVWERGVNAPAPQLSPKSGRRESMRPHLSLRLNLGGGVNAGCSVLPDGWLNALSRGTFCPSTRQCAQSAGEG